jgi:DNA-binding transcriptional MerR regulator
LKLPQHVLRFWETRFSQIKPLKRGGNRRYYRPQDVDLLRAIRSQLYDKGLTIKGVQKMLREQGASAIRDDGGDEPQATSRAPEATDLSDLRRALDDLREAERLLELARLR